MVVCSVFIMITDIDDESLLHLTFFEEYQMSQKLGICYHSFPGLEKVIMQ